MSTWRVDTSDAAADDHLMESIAFGGSLNKFVPGLCKLVHELGNLVVVRDNLFERALYACRIHN